MTSIQRSRRKKTSRNSRQLKNSRKKKASKIKKTTSRKIKKTTSRRKKTSRKSRLLKTKMYKKINMKMLTLPLNQYLATYTDKYGEIGIIDLYNRWIADGGTLLNYKLRGCGINCLAMLGVISRTQGNAMIEEIQRNPELQNIKTFNEMTKFVELVNPNIFSPALFGNLISIAGDDLRKFILDMKEELSPNSCTIVKLMRHTTDSAEGMACNGSQLTAGHYCVIGMQNGGTLPGSAEPLPNNSLIVADPQLTTIRTMEDEGPRYDTLRRSYDRQCYTHIAVMSYKFRIPEVEIQTRNQELRQRRQIHNQELQTIEEQEQAQEEERRILEQERRLLEQERQQLNDRRNSQFISRRREIAQEIREERRFDRQTQRDRERAEALRRARGQPPVALNVAPPVALNVAPPVAGPEPMEIDAYFDDF